MPAYGTAQPSARDNKIQPLSPADIRDLVEFLIGQQGRSADRAAAGRGARLFAGAGGCFDCHAADGKGDSSVGAPNLTDGITLYGVIDMDFQYETHGAPFSNYFISGGSDIVQKNSNNAVQGITSNGMSQSRIGLQGKEPLNFFDWSGVFKVETYFNPASGQITDAQSKYNYAGQLPGSFVNPPNGYAILQAPSSPGSFCLYLNFHYDFTHSATLATNFTVN